MCWIAYKIIRHLMPSYFDYSHVFFVFAWGIILMFVIQTTLRYDNPEYIAYQAKIEKNKLYQKELKNEMMMIRKERNQELKRLAEKNLQQKKIKF